MIFRGSARARVSVGDRPARGASRIPRLSCRMLLVVRPFVSSQPGGCSLGCRAADESWGPPSLEHWSTLMPLTPYQAGIARLLSGNRTPDSYLAGGAALNIE